MATELVLAAALVLAMEQESALASGMALVRMLVLASALVREVAGVGDAVVDGWRWSR
jgi:hypothetical protein